MEGEGVVPVEETPAALENPPRPEDEVTPPKPNPDLEFAVEAVVLAFSVGSIGEAVTGAGLGPGVLSLPKPNGVLVGAVESVEAVVDVPLASETPVAALAAGEVAGERFQVVPDILAPKPAVEPLAAPPKPPNEPKPVFLASGAIALDVVEEEGEEPGEAPNNAASLAAVALASLEAVEGEALATGGGPRRAAAEAAAALSASEAAEGLFELEGSAAALAAAFLSATEDEKGLIDGNGEVEGGFAPGGGPSSAAALAAAFLSASVDSEGPEDAERVAGVDVEVLAPNALAGALKPKDTVDLAPKPVEGAAPGGAPSLSASDAAVFLASSLSASVGVAAVAVVVGELVLAGGFQEGLLPKPPAPKLTGLLPKLLVEAPGGAPSLAASAAAVFLLTSS
jgi:hypothetical protein